MTNENTEIKRPKPVVLVILDGWGISQPYTGNAITQADTPFINSLISEYPSITLLASGESVGLPWGEPGNSEVGHTNIGLGKILYQDLPRINKEISDNSFFQNKVLLEAVNHAKNNNSSLHLMGIVSNGCVHGSIDHLHALLVLAKEQKIKNVYIHAILDGRDVSFNSGMNFIKGIEKSIEEYKIGAIATVAGRYYTMDRNNNWDRIEKGYLAMTAGIGNKAESAVQAIEESYGNKIYDEEFVPTVIEKNGKPVAVIDDNDAIIFFNFRPDRARQITQAFTAEKIEKFNRQKLITNLYYACFTEYEKGLPVHIVFESDEVKNTLGDVVANAGLKQLRIAETEKYAHVTYFFNGGKEEKSSGEEHILIPSPQVSSYDQKPEMSAGEITDRLVKEIDANKHDMIIVNYANADMVGHTGNIIAAIKAIEFLDKCVSKVTKAILNKGGVLMITADHGNAEVMFNMQTGQIDKEHTTNPVPFILVGNEYRGKSVGWKNVAGSDLSLVQPQGILADIAPTMLKVLNIEKSEEMSGVSLI